jgi:hypothetical protein
MPSTVTDANIAEYVNLLHTHGVNSKQAKALRAQCASDDLFVRRARVADELFLHRDEILAALDAPRSAPAAAPHPGPRSAAAAHAP